MPRSSLEDDSFDRHLRQEAMEWLRIQTEGGHRPLSNHDLSKFEFRGQPFRLKATQTGIWKPRQLTAALSIVTVYRKPGVSRPYEDSPAADGLYRYAWRGEDSGHSDNKALRTAMEQQKPLIWFQGVGSDPSVFLPIFPVFLINEEPMQRQFVVDLVDKFEQPDSPLEEAIKRYRQVLTRQRLHQPIFRSMVLAAYQSRCAVCSLKQASLLDAAHIIPDNEADGIASVSNGLALCKLHHAAFDNQILGITPDYVVRIREEILHEAGGSMLRYGLQNYEGQKLLTIPKSTHKRPDQQLLHRSYEKFLSSQSS